MHGCKFQGYGGGVANTPRSKPEPALKNKVPDNPCKEAGAAPDPSRYEQLGKDASPVKNIFNLLKFRRGAELDAQVGLTPSGTKYGGSPAYANYVFGVYMSAYGYTLGQTLVLADVYAEQRSHYAQGTPMAGPQYPFTHRVNVENILNGFNAQQNGTLCHK